MRLREQAVVLRAAVCEAVGNEGWKENWQEGRAVIQLDKTDLFSVEWNRYVGKYLAFSSRASDFRIQIRTADRPEGPWSEPAIEIETLSGDQ